MDARTLIEAAPRAGCRHLLAPAAWRAVADDPGTDLLALWADPQEVHAAWLDAGGLLLASTAVADGGYPALSPARPGAVRFERAVRELWGHAAQGGVDLRPWLDHGRWPVAAPMSARPDRSPPPAEPMGFLPIEGEGWHQIPVGPVHAGIIEPGHFRFTVQGEAVVRLEQRLGYTHKGTLPLMVGKPPRTAARFAARLSGDSTVAHAWAFAMAVEAALGVAPPPRAVGLRGVMAELERIANHLNDWGFICNDAAFAYVHARTGALREAVLRAAQAAFGSRLMMDAVVPGGVVRDLDAGGAAALLAALATVEHEIPALRRLTESHAGLQDRLAGTGRVAPALAAAFAAGGHVGRASGRGFDARRALPYAPYGAGLDVPVLADGDVRARLAIRIAELPVSIALVRRFLGLLAPGDLLVALPQQAGEGVGVVEAFRGEALTWVALDEGGAVRAVFARDASWLQWPLLEAAIEGNIVADFPLCNKSFNCSYSGVDL